MGVVDLTSFVHEVCRPANIDVGSKMPNGPIFEEAIDGHLDKLASQNVVWIAPIVQESKKCCKSGNRLTSVRGTGEETLPTGRNWHDSPAVHAAR